MRKLYTTTEKKLEAIKDEENAEKVKREDKLNNKQ